MKKINYLSSKKANRSLGFSTKTVWLGCILFYILTINCAIGQQSFVATGGDFSNSEGSASFSVGQVAYGYTSSSNGSVSEGVQQSYDISIALGINVENVQLKMTIYPNPTANNLVLNIDANDIENYSFYVFNDMGQRLLTNDLYSNKTVIQLEKYPQGSYFVSVIKKENLIKTFKVIKK